MKKNSIISNENRNEIDHGIQRFQSSLKIIVNEVSSVYIDSWLS